MKKIFVIGILIFSMVGIYAMDNVKSVGNIWMKPPYSSVGVGNTMFISTDDVNNVYLEITDNKMMLTRKDKDDTIALLKQVLDLSAKESDSNYYKYIGVVNSSGLIYKGYVTLTYINKGQERYASFSILVSYVVKNYLMEMSQVRELIMLLDKSGTVADSIASELKKVP